MLWTVRFKFQILLFFSLLSTQDCLGCMPFEYPGSVLTPAEKLGFQVQKITGIWSWGLTFIFSSRNFVKWFTWIFISPSSFTQASSSASIPPTWSPGFQLVCKMIVIYDSIAVLNESIIELEIKISELFMADFCTTRAVAGTERTRITDWSK